MIWQNFILRVLFSEEACLQNLQIDLEAKRMDGLSWKKNSIVSVLTLFVAAFKSFPPWMASIVHNLDKFLCRVELKTFRRWFDNEKGQTQ